MTRPRLPGTPRRPGEYNPEAAERDVQDDQERYILEGLAMTRYGQPIAEERESHNRTGLGAGEHGGGSLTKPNGILAGLSPGATVTRKLTIAADNIVQGVTFYGEEAESVRVTSGATVIFRDCMFRKEDRATRTHIVIESGCHAIFQGCMWVGGTGGTTCVIDNQSSIDCVQVQGSYNATGNFIGLVMDAEGNIGVDVGVHNINSWFLTKDNDGSTIQATVNASGAAQVWQIGPAAGEVWELERVLWEAVGVGSSHSAYSILSTLTNGVIVRATSRVWGGSVRRLDGGLNVMDQADLRRLCYDVQSPVVVAGGPPPVNEAVLSARWSFYKMGDNGKGGLLLFGDDGDYLEVVVNDDFSTLVSHTWLTQGFIRGC